MRAQYSTRQMLQSYH